MYVYFLLWKNCILSLSGLVVVKCKFNIWKWLFNINVIKMCVIDVFVICVYLKDNLKCLISLRSSCCVVSLLG